MNAKVKVYLKIRRFDLKDNPDSEDLQIEFEKNIDYQSLKRKMYSTFNVSEKEKVLKIRNEDNCLIPLSDILEGNCRDRPFIVDVVTIKYTDAHKAALNKKFESLLLRLTRAEEAAQDLQWRKQAKTEESINILTERVEFLNRRFEQLLPVEMKQHLPSTSQNYS